jgi:hypothetical protein
LTYEDTFITNLHH